MRHYAVQSRRAKAPLALSCGAARLTERPLLGDEQPPRPEPANIGLPFPRHFTQNDGMANQTGPDTPKSFLRWATTPPQAYVVYLVCLILVYALSFFAGTMKPKKTEGLGPPSVMTPQK